jgi:LPS O-antigen subunit length determinant protein (WzzB/FepE family)
MSKGKNNQGTVTLNEETPRSIEELVNDFFSSGKKVSEFEKELGQRERIIWNAKKDEFLLDEFKESPTSFDDDEEEDFLDDRIGY